MVSMQFQYSLANPAFPEKQIAKGLVLPADLEFLILDGAF